jgi:hypothetical protein
MVPFPSLGSAHSMALESTHEQSQHGGFLREERMRLRLQFVTSMLLEYLRECAIHIGGEDIGVNVTLAADGLGIAEALGALSSRNA